MNVTEPKICDVSLDGFQIVNSLYFSRVLEPTMTLFKTAISFSCSALNALQGCDAVHIMVNEKTRCIIARPCSTKDPNAVSWSKNVKKNTGNRIECTAFARQIYEGWGLNPDVRYKASGKLVQADKKVMLLFDFNHCEAWHGNKVVK